MQFKRLPVWDNASFAVPLASTIVGGSPIGFNAGASVGLSKTVARRPTCLWFVPWVGLLFVNAASLATRDVPLRVSKERLRGSHTRVRDTAPRASSAVELAAL